MTVSLRRTTFLISCFQDQNHLCKFHSDQIMSLCRNVIEHKWFISQINNSGQIYISQSEQKISIIIWKLQRSMSDDCPLDTECLNRTKGTSIVCRLKNNLLQLLWHVLLLFFSIKWPIILIDIILHRLCLTLGNVLSMYFVLYVEVTTHRRGRRLHSSVHSSVQECPFSLGTLLYTTQMCRGIMIQILEVKHLWKMDTSPHLMCGNMKK